MNKVWSEQEKVFIRNNSGNITDAEGARQLSAISGRTISVHSWRKQRQKLELKKAPGRGVCRLAKTGLAGEVASSGQSTVTAHTETTDSTTGIVTEHVTLQNEAPAQQDGCTMNSDGDCICGEPVKLPVEAPAEGNGEKMVSEGAPVQSTEGLSNAQHYDF